MWLGRGSSSSGSALTLSVTLGQWLSSPGLSVPTETRMWVDWVNVEDPLALDLGRG